MKCTHRLLLLLAACALGQAAFAADAVRAADASFEFTLDRPATTSAGVYDADGRLVRVLWAMEKTDAGKSTRAWDGKDDAGQPAPAGEYHFQIIANRAAYVNVGAIGNSGQPADAAGHTPTHMAAVAVDDEGSVYTANGWDEAGADFKKWDKDGKSVYDANFQIRNGKPNGAPYAIAVDDQYIYCSVGGWARAPFNEAQQIQRFRRTDGKEEKFTKTGRDDGHIQVYEWPSKQIPDGTPEDEAERMKLPLRGIAVSGDTFFLADYIGNRVLKFDKVTGEPRGSFVVHRPQALTIARERMLIVAFDHRKTASYDLNGAFQMGDEPSPATQPALDGDSAGRAPPTTNYASGLVKRDGKWTFHYHDNNNPVGEYEAMAFGPDGWLSIADSKMGVVWRRKGIFDPQATVADIVADSFGLPATPGDRAPNHFFHLNGVAVAKDGSFVTIQDEPFGGARLAKWSPDPNQGPKLAWEQFGCEFVSLGNYAADDPDTFYSMTFHRYKLGDHAAGKWDYTGCVAPFETRRFYSDVHGVPRVLTLAGQHFYFLPSGDGVQVYRVEAKQLKLASLVGGRRPAPDGQPETKQLGQWSWHDANGTGEPKPDEINWFKKSGEGHYACFGMDVDFRGNLLFADLSTHSIREIPIGSPDSRGNPTYDWKDAGELIPKDESPLKFEPNMAQRAEDGSIYSFGWSARLPQPKNNPFWMGGTTLVRFDKTGKRLWAVELPKLCVGLDVIPGGGCIAGIGNGARLLHYTPGGLLIGSMEPGEAMHKQTGWLDNHASVAVNRDPRDHKLDIFAEDDYTLRIAWYRVDDNAMETMSGTIQLR